MRDQGSATTVLRQDSSRSSSKHQDAEVARPDGWWANMHAVHGLCRRRCSLLQAGWPNDASSEARTCGSRLRRMVALAAAASMMAPAVGASRS